MNLRLRIMLSLNGLLLVTVAVVSALTLYTTISGLKETVRRDALGTASLLSSAAAMTVQAPQEVEAMIGYQMEAQARILAHWVALAEGRAGLDTSEINRILREITDHSTLDEIWITGTKPWVPGEPAEAHLFSTQAQLKALFAFSPDPQDQPQASAFYPLLKDKTGKASVIQTAQRREIDPAIYKYVGVSGVDKPRIVMVGKEAEFIRARSSQFAVNRWVRNVIDAGNLQAIYVADPAGQPVVCSSPSGEEGLIDRYFLEQLDVVALETARRLKPTARFLEGAVEASVPLTGFGGRAGALICQLSTDQLDRAIASALRDVVVLSLAALIAGALVSSLLARRISGPIRTLAEAAAEIGSGRFAHRVPIHSDDEVGRLAVAFNQMADSLKGYTQELARSSAEKEALRREMDIASEIQRSLLPEACPSIPGVDVAAESVPALDVGGDFFDFIPLPNGRWGVVIADASGKGVPAALFMALSRSLIRAHSSSKLSAVEALRLANDYMLQDMRSGMFVTCFYGIIDPTNSIFHYVNAGHNPPMVNKVDGRVVLLPASGTPLGILDDPGIQEESHRLEPGDVLFMYTDGITEAVDNVGEQFGVARLQEVVKNCTPFTAQGILDRALTAVRTFAGDLPQFDDMTVVAVKILAE
jgi:serine phosphatase RsbU (regulator of sigma subunit)